MEGFYQGQYGADDGDSMLGMMGMTGMYSAGPATAQSLGDIVNQNTKAMRRRSVPAHYSANNTNVDDATMRRVSISEFTGNANGSLDGFQFDPSAATPMDGILPTGGTYAPLAESIQTQTSGAGEMGLNAHLYNHPASYVGIPTTATTSAFASPLHQNSSLDMELASPYMPNGLSVPIDMVDSSLTGMMGTDPGAMNLFPPSQFDSSMITSPISPDFTPRLQDPTPDSSVATSDPKDRFASVEAQSATPDTHPSRPSSHEHGITADAASKPPTISAHGAPTQISQIQYGPESPPQPPVQDITKQQFPWTLLAGGFPSTMHSRPHSDTPYKNAYSSSGFDMLGVLMRVATRPNPEINIGSVDLSCAFVVCDAEKDDFPIVYCSDNFERLTGYSKHMILGRNCRFLQSPDGKVESGIKRKYVDNESVYYLKRMILSYREAQISLINYRRGGQPFMNLLTMIPIPWDNPQKTRFFVGFQVDLVEQPGAVNAKNPDGSFNINYQRGFLPPYMLHSPEANMSLDAISQTVSRDEVSNALSNYASMQEGEFARRLWDRVLLENTDDVIHVLSLKGLFLYLSAACKKVLEYEPAELVGMALSSVCHPSDIVPVTRELKDTSPGVAVNIVYRIRRKTSGYMWFEGHGALHSEQGKGRKCIIMVGRERPVYSLSQREIFGSGGIVDNELWTKMSTSGMLLFVSSNVRQLLDRQPDELIGVSIQTLMRQESKAELGRMLELVRSGKKASFKHEMINKRGQVIQAFTNLYPGDATEGHKPTFVVAQTKFSKMTRGSSAAYRSSMPGKQDGESRGSVMSLSSGAPSSLANLGSETTAHSSVSLSQYVPTEGLATTFSGQQGLALGHQDATLASEDNLFEELQVTRSSSWQYELRQMEKRNRILAEEVQSLLAAKKKRKRRKGAGQLQKDCANCHTRTTPEWRRGPSGNRDLCNSCGLRWAKQNGRVSPRTSSQQSVKSGQSDKASRTSASPKHVQTTALSNITEIGPSSVSGSVVNTGQPADQDGHTAKATRTEASANQGLHAGIPAKIDEVAEPD